MNKKLLYAIFGVTIVGIGFFYASPYIVLNSIKNDAKAGDSEKVSAYIDYANVRQSFKDQINAYMLKQISNQENDAWETLGAMMATKMVEKMVDATVTPEAMTLMLQGQDFKQNVEAQTQGSSDQHKDESALDYSARYLSFNMFEVTLRETAQDSAPGDIALKVIMLRDGFSWKVSKLVLPMDEFNALNRKAPAQVHTPTATALIEAPVEIPALIENRVEQHKLFNHAKVQKGAIIESCYHSPCSIAKVQAFKQLSQTKNRSNIELLVIGGSREWDSKKIEWNYEPHTLQVSCSITQPSLGFGDDLEILPLNPSGVPGAIYSSAVVYTQACHANDDVEQVITKYGYNVNDPN